jgi:putative holliday junction resolvase
MYLAIDLGDKRCWLAIAIDGIVFPKDIVLRTKLIQEVKKYISKYKITVIIVWLPYDLHGKMLKQLDKTKRFIIKLQEIFPDIKIDWCDERFTTFAADEISMQMGDDEKRDDISAALILEAYLEQIK